MKIKDKLALNFTLISTGMLLVVLGSVYFIFLKFLEADFYARLTDRTMVTAKLYLEADEISRDALNKVRSQYLEKLNDEVIRIYDESNKATFIGDRAQYWTSQAINKVRKAGKVQFKDGTHQVVGIFYKDNQGDFVILASATDLGSHKRLSKLFKVMLFTFFGFSILLLLSGRWIAKRILRPLQFFMEEVEKIGSSNLEFRVTESNNKDEINQLAKTFNRLIEELEQAFILQKTFVSNASHELRTPVTRVMMSAELALSKERDTTAYKKTLYAIVEDADKINNIISGLLTLAKADLEMTKAHLSTLNIFEMLLSLQAEWHTQQQLELTVDFEQCTYKPLVKANQTLLAIALNNIIANAFKFSNNQVVSCRISCNQNRFNLSFSDNGTGISADDLNHIFKPFYSRSQKIGKQGDGMGLYMASQIIHLFNGEIITTSKIGQGSTFTVLLPRL